ncbi:MAG: hypothetical protein MR828_10480 [Clostridiales bacterium]|nr:hypothetical protein [Clostridiales bacterium]
MIIEVRADESRVISFVPPSHRGGFVFAKSFMHLGFTHQSNKLMFGDTLTAALGSPYGGAKGCCRISPPSNNWADR